MSSFSVLPATASLPHYCSSDYHECASEEGHSVICWGLPSGLVCANHRMSTTVGLASVADRGRDGEDDSAGGTPHGSAPSDDGLARRLKALACTAPLHDLDARKGRLDWADASAYQMAEIAFLAIDQVTIAMDFDRGASQEDIAARLVPLVAVQVPGRDPAEYARVANWVIDNLINVGSLDRGFKAIYGRLPLVATGRVSAPPRQPG
jgi:hypothetical protein